MLSCFFHFFKVTYSFREIRKSKVERSEQKKSEVKNNLRQKSIILIIYQKLSQKSFVLLSGF